MALPQELEKLGVLRKREDILKRRAKAAALKRAMFESFLYEEMVEEGWTPNDSGVRLGHVTFSPQRTDYATIQDASKFSKWAADHDEVMLELKPRKKQLNELVRRLLDNGEPMPPGLGYHTKTYISQRGANVNDAPDIGEEDE